MAPVAVLRSALLVLCLAPEVLSAQARSSSFDVSVFADRLDHRDDNASRLRYSGVMPGGGLGYRIVSPSTRLAFTGELRAGDLSAQRGGGAETFTDAGFAMTYARRVRGAFVGASLAGTMRAIEHRYATGFSEDFWTSDVSLRPEATFRLSALGATDVRVAATAAAWVLRPYSRTKAGNTGSLEMRWPTQWRDASVSVERSFGEGGRAAHRVGYALRALAYAADNGYAAVRSTVYLTTAFRLRGAP